MSENNDTFLENETNFWDGKRDDNPSSIEFECCETECSGNCNCTEDTETVTFCCNCCDETYGQCLDCEIDDIWRKTIRGKSSKESVDAWISMKTLLISCMKDNDSDTVKHLKKEVEILHILREMQNN